MNDGDEPEVLAERRGRLGLLTLNRPRALNALTHRMVRAIAAALDGWAEDDTVAVVAVTGAGDRALCAGGDVVSLRHDVTTGDGSGAAAFWRDEYALNARIARYGKPYVAIQDGVVLGGGIGISAHGSHRIVTETSKLGFPEVTIGFVPDVGATWLLSRAPGETGARLALTAGSVGAADAIYVGFSDRFVPRDRVPELLARLEKENVDVVLAELHADPGPPPLAAERRWADPAFAAGSVAEVVARLRAIGAAEASRLADAIDVRSPLALAVTLESLRRARSLTSLEEALEQEFRVSCHASARPDFAEGIRAQLVDKDRSPSWSPPAHDLVTADDVAGHFTEPTGGGLRLGPVR